jgi:hypothetical protein
MAVAIQKTRVYIWLRGDDMLKSDEEDQMMQLLYDIIGDINIRRMEFEYAFEDGDDVGCLEMRMSSRISLDDATNIANTIKQSIDLCKGEYKKFKSWFDSAQAYTRVSPARRYCIVDEVVGCEK